MTPRQPPRPPSRRGRTLASVAGIAIGLAGLAAVLFGVGFGGDPADVLALLRSADPVGLLPAIGLAALSMGMVGVMWSRVLAALGKPVPILATLRWYWIGSMGKYLPGGIWPAVGRGELATAGGVDRPTAYLSVGVSVALTYMAAALTVLLAAPFASTVEVPLQVGALRSLLVIPFGLLLLHPRVGGRIVGWVGRRFSGGAEGDGSSALPSGGTTVGLLLAHLPVWLLVGVTQLLVTGLLAEAGGYAAPHAGVVIMATALAWLGGFLAIPVPSGIGVREAIFVAALPGLPPDLAAGAALLGRAVFVLGDALAAGLALLLPSDRSD